MTMERSQRLVFVSHSGIDTWVAKQIAREIAGCGAVPFLDEAEIDVGADFVVLITPWALDRPYVWAELGAAWGRPSAFCTGSRPENCSRGPEYRPFSRGEICYP